MACKLTAQQLAELETLHAKGDAQGFADALRMHLDPTFTGSALEMWKAGLLTSPSTHAANMIGNTLNLATDVFTTAVAGGIVDPVLSRLTGKERQIRAGEMGAQVAGMRSVAGDAFRRFVAETMEALTFRPEGLPGQEEFEAAAESTKKGIAGGVKKAVKSGFPTAAGDVVGKFEGPPVGRISGKKGVVIRTPFRLLEAADAFFKRLISSGELYRHAHRSGVAAGLRGGALHRHMERVVNEFHADVVKAQGRPEKLSPQNASLYQAMQVAARKGTFQEPNRDDWFGRATHHFQQVLSDMPLLQFIVPFTRTPANIARKSFELTPAGMIGPAFDVLRTGNFSANESERIARALLGTIVSSVLVALAREGYLTGSGPTDPKERTLKEQTGWQPYSFVIPEAGSKPGDKRNTYIQFGRFEPVASMASVAADLVETTDETEARSLGKKLLAGVTNAFTSKTFLQGAERLFELWSDPFRYGEGFAKSLAGSVVPAGVAAAARATDSTVRDTSRGGLGEQVAATIKSRVPGLSESLPARKTGLGVDVERKSPSLARLLSPAQVTQDDRGPYADLQREMVAVGYVPRALGGTITIKGRDGKPKPVEMTAQEEETLQAGLAKGADMAIAMMRSPSWRRRPAREADGDGSREEALRKTFERARAEARARVRRMVSSRLRTTAIMAGE